MLDSVLRLASEFIEIHSDTDTLANYGRDWRKEITPNAGAVVFPTNISEIQRLVHFASQYKLSLIPSGGRTGLSGGATAINQEIVVSFDKMNRMEPVDVPNMSVSCESGVVTAKLLEHVKNAGLYLPLQFSSQESSQIGGNIATCVGGERVLKYGSLKSWITGLVVVDGRGDVHHLNNGLIKNRSGYDLMNLFIGSEGTLGFITNATFKLKTESQHETNLMLAAINNIESIADIFLYLNQNFDIELFELIDRKSLNLVNTHHQFKELFAKPFPYYLLIELQKSEDIEEKLCVLLEEDITDLVIAQDKKQYSDLLARRARISETLSAHYNIVKFDVAVRLKDIPRFVQHIELATNRDLADVDLATFGHVGDGNLHLNFFSTSPLKEMKHNITRVVEQVIREFRGTMSGEHGIGLMKKDLLCVSVEPHTIDLMRQIKRVFDPQNIINPGKIFD